MELVDVEGAFLNGTFEPQHQMYLHITKGFEQDYPTDAFLRLLKTFYGTKQAAMQFWKKSCLVLRLKFFTRSKADACLHFQWSVLGLVLFLSWVDDVFLCGPNAGVQKAKQEFTAHLKCNEQGEMKEYVGCQIERDFDDSHDPARHDSELETYYARKTDPSYSKEMILRCIALELESCFIWHNGHATTSGMQ
jgi:hypothetical protein